MTKSAQIYDACLLSLSELNTDARILNIARTLVKHGKSVCIIAIGTHQDVINYSLENITLLYMNDKLPKRAWKKWLQYTLKARKYINHAIAKTYWAGDLYTLFVAKELARIHKGRLFYDSREIYSAIGSLSKKPYKQSIQSLYEKRHIKHVKKLIVSGRLDGEYLKDYFKIDIPVHTIMNLPPYRTYEKKDLIREKYSIPKDKKILIYQGMLIPGRGLIPLVEAMAHLDGHILCIFGEGGLKEELLKRASTLKVEEKVLFCGSVPYDELYKWTGSADIGIAFIEPISYSYSLALPNKLFEYCMARIPSLVSDLPAMRAIIAQHKIGKIISPTSSPEVIAEAINEMSADSNYSEFILACDEAAKIYCYEAQEETILSLLY